MQRNLALSGVVQPLLSLGYPQLSAWLLDPTLALEDGVPSFISVLQGISDKAADRAEQVPSFAFQYALARQALAADEEGGVLPTPDAEALEASAPLADGDFNLQCFLEALVVFGELRKAIRALGEVKEVVRVSLLEGESSHLSYAGGDSSFSLP